MVTQIIYSEEFNKHDNPGHPENAKRTDIMLKELKKTPFYKEIETTAPTLIDEEKILEIHSESMIDRIKEINFTGKSWIDLDTYVCMDDYYTARLAAGGTVQAAIDVLKEKTDNAFILARPPGHHATKKRSMGFCLFNNTALAANEITKKGKKVLIFDPDVHHGNGTQDIFYKRDDVLYQSFHVSPHFPGTGEIEETGEGKGSGYNINAPLPFGYGNTAVRQLLDEIFLPVAKQFKPDIIIISSGFDSHHSDPLGGLKLTSNFFGTMIKDYQDIQPKIVCTLEGGYNLQWIGKCLISQIAQLSQNKTQFNDKTDEKKDITKILAKIKENIKDKWDI